MAELVKTMIADLLPYFVVWNAACLMGNSVIVDYHGAKKAFSKSTDADFGAHIVCREDQSPYRRSSPVLEAVRSNKPSSGAGGSLQWMTSCQEPGVGLRC